MLAMIRRMRYRSLRKRVRNTSRLYPFKMVYLCDDCKEYCRDDYPRIAQAFGEKHKGCLHWTCDHGMKPKLRRLTRGMKEFTGSHALAG